MRTHRILSITLCAAAFAAPAWGQKSPTTDVTFAQKAAIGGMTEVEASKLAVQKASDPKVKSFAQHMVADHTKANEALKKAASAEGVTLPAGLDAEHKDKVAKLEGLSGKEFDDAYKTQMVDDHKTTVAMFEDKVKENPKTPIGSFAADTLPTLRTHREMAEDLAGGTPPEKKKPY